MGKRLESAVAVARSFERIGLSLHATKSSSRFYCIYNGNKINVTVIDSLYVNEDEEDDKTETAEIYFNLELPESVYENVSNKVFNASLRIMEYVLNKKVWCIGTQDTGSTDSFGFCLGVGQTCNISDFSWSLTLHELYYDRPKLPYIGKRELRKILQMLNDAYQLVASNNLLIPNGLCFDGKSIRGITIDS